MSLMHSLREGSRGVRIFRLQSRLNGLGIPAGDEDGIFGFKTKRAVQDFQRLMRIHSDGVAGRITLRMLHREKVPIKLYVHKARKGESLKSAARHMGVNAKAIARATRIPADLEYAPEEGSTLYALGRMVLGVDWGYLPPGGGSWPGWHTGAAYVLGADGTLKALEGSKAHGDVESHGMPVIVMEDPGILASAKAVQCGMKGIREILGGAGPVKGILVVLPRVSGGLAQGVPSFLSALKRTLGKGKSLMVAVPVVDERRGRRAAPILELRKVLGAADYAVLMAWRETALTTGNGPVAPLPWLVGTLKAALRDVEPWRVLLGVCGSCVRRDGDEMPRFIPYGNAAKAMSIFASRGEWDSTTQTPSFSYIRRGNRSDFIFENAESIGLKAMMADRRNMAGMAVFDCAWADPGIQGRIEEVFVVTPPAEFWRNVI